MIIHEEQRDQELNRKPSGQTAADPSEIIVLDEIIEIEREPLKRYAKVVSEVEPSMHLHHVLPVLLIIVIHVLN